MNGKDAKKKEGRIIRLFFWCMVAPSMFLVFTRLFFVLFSFIYSPVVLLLTGRAVDNLLFVLSLITAVALTVATIYYIYKMLNRHIIKG